MPTPRDEFKDLINECLDERDAKKKPAAKKPAAAAGSGVPKKPDPDFFGSMMDWVRGISPAEDDTEEGK